MGCKSSTPNAQVPNATAQFDADWLPFLDGKTVNDYKRVVRANVPFASHEQGQAWAEETLKRMHTGLERRGLAGVYKYDQVGQQANGQISITCNVTRPPGAGGAPAAGGEMNRNITYQLQYMVAASGPPAN